MFVKLHLPMVYIIKCFKISRCLFARSKSITYLLIPMQSTSDPYRLVTHLVSGAAILEEWQTCYKETQTYLLLNQCCSPWRQLLDLMSKLLHKGLCITPLLPLLSPIPTKSLIPWTEMGLTFLLAEAADTSQPCQFHFKSFLLQWYPVRAGSLGAVKMSTICQRAIRLSPLKSSQNNAGI